MLRQIMQVTPLFTVRFLAKAMVQAILDREVEGRIYMMWRQILEADELERRWAVGRETLAEGPLGSAEFEQGVELAVIIVRYLGWWKLGLADKLNGLWLLLSVSLVARSVSFYGARVYIPADRDASLEIMKPSNRQWGK